MNPSPPDVTPAEKGGNVPLRSLGLLELSASGAAFIAPAFSLAAIFVAVALTGGRLAPEGVVLGTLAALLAASCFVAMSRRHPRAGGAYALVAGELPRPVAFCAGWGLCLLYLLGPAIPLFLVVLGMETLEPALLPYGIGLAAGVAVTVAAINALGLRPSARVALALFLFEAGVLLVVAAELLRRPAVPLPPAPSGAGSLALALGGSAALAVFLFLGFDSVSAYAEEAHVPRRDVGRGTVLAILVAAVIYITSAFAYLRAVDWAAPSASYPGSLASLLGPSGAFMLELVIVVSSAGALIAVENACARVLFAMARDRMLPSPMARLFGKARVPWVPLGLSALLTGGLTVWAVGTLPSSPGLPLALMFTVLPALVVVGALVAYLLVAIAWVKALLAGKRAGARWLVSLLMAVGSAVLSGALLLLQPLSWTTGATAMTPWPLDMTLGLLLAWFAVGIAIWAATRARGDRPSHRPSPGRTTDVEGPTP